MDKPKECPWCGEPITDKGWLIVGNLIVCHGCWLDFQYEREQDRR